MLRITDHLVRFHAGRLAAVAAFAILVSGYCDPARGQQPGQKTFSSSEEACAALLKAVQQADEAGLQQILVPTAKEIVSGGDHAEDLSAQRQFVEKYREMHRLVREPDGTTTLYVGAENWPLPILLKRKANTWDFH